MSSSPVLLSVIFGTPLCFQDCRRCKLPPSQAKDCKESRFLDSAFTQGHQGHAAHAANWASQEQAGGTRAVEAALSIIKLLPETGLTRNSAQAQCERERSTSSITPTVTVEARSNPNPLSNSWQGVLSDDVCGSGGMSCLQAKHQKASQTVCQICGISNED